MIATTIISSMSVKPCERVEFIATGVGPYSFESCRNRAKLVPMGRAAQYALQIKRLLARSERPHRDSRPVLTNSVRFGRSRARPRVFSAVTLFTIKWKLWGLSCRLEEYRREK